MNLIRKAGFLLVCVAKVGQRQAKRTTIRLKQTVITLIPSLFRHILTGGIHTFPENICLNNWNC